MRAAPQKALDFFAFDLFKALGLQTFAAAAAAGATSNAILYPLEVRMSDMFHIHINGCSIAQPVLIKVLHHPDQV